ncbi:MAG: MFS transporter [Actinomycetia bacterium]|nr:MFS transporter [Actinomycetes bacterium]
MKHSTLQYQSARRALAARTINGAGSWMQTTAASWWVLNESGQATAVGALVVVAFLPKLFLSPIGGILADRYSPVLLERRFAWLSAIAPLLLAALLWLDALNVYLLLLIVLIGAPPSALAAPLMPKILPMTVPPDLKPAILANGALTYNISRVLGPLFASVLIVTVGVGGAFLLNGLSYLFLWLIMARTNFDYRSTKRAGADAAAAKSAGQRPSAPGQPAVPVSEAEPVSAESEARGEAGAESVGAAPEDRRGYRADLRAGWTFDVARVAFIGALVFYAFVGPVQQLLAVVARSHGESAAYLGYLFAALAVGGIASNPFIKRFLGRGGNKHLLIDVALIASGPILICLGLSSHLLSDMVLLAAMGAAGEALWLGAQTSLVLDLPDDISGHMIGLFYGVTTGVIALGAVAVGYLFDLIGTRLALICLGALAGSYGLVSLLRFRRRLREETSQVTQPTAR